METLYTETGKLETIKLPAFRYVADFGSYNATFASVNLDAGKYEIAFIPVSHPKYTNFFNCTSVVFYDEKNLPRYEVTFLNVSPAAVQSFFKKSVLPAHSAFRNQ